MRNLLRALGICVLGSAAVASAQENPLTTNARHIYGGMKRILLATAEKVPEADYKFQPTDSVRTLGQVLGHVADSQYSFCSVVLGEKDPAKNIEEKKTSKAELIEALKDAFAYCDKAYAGITDASGTQTVKLFGGDMPKLGVLSVITAHDAEHYGNLVTYMRMRGIVPPTSDPTFQAVPKK